MSQRSLTGVKVAILVANGFDENSFSAAQRALQDAGANARIVSSEQGLVCGWNGAGWGHHFAVDTQLKAALAADYQMLVIPGGMRSVEKLRSTAHTKRFVSGFMLAGKPVAVFGDGIHTLAGSYDLAGRAVTGPAAQKDAISQTGANWTEDALCVDNNLLTSSVVQGEDAVRPVAAMITFFSELNLKTAMPAVKAA